MHRLVDVLIVTIDLFIYVSIIIFAKQQEEIKEINKQKPKLSNLKSVFGIIEQIISFLETHFL